MLNLSVLLKTYFVNYHIQVILSKSLDTNPIQNNILHILFSNVIKKYCKNIIYKV